MDSDKDELERKRQHYQAMDSSTESEDETPDPGRESSMTAMQRAPGTRPAEVSNHSGLNRSISDSAVGLRKKQQQQPTRERPPGKPSSSAGVHPPSIGCHTLSDAPDGPVATDKVASSAISKATGKRKRKDEAPVVPEGQQIFRGLTFYFFPNSDKHPARKLRIAKAIEFGANWQREYDESVTHVIVDKGMDYGLLIKFLKRDTLPAKVIVVSEDYPAECISYRTLLDPRRIQYKVKGYTGGEDVRPVSAESDTSLQLKGSGKSATTRQPRTPYADSHPPRSTQAEDSDEASSPARPPPLVEVVSTKPDPLESIAAHIESTEEFDIAIQQARELENVPLDPDDEPASRPTSSEGPDTDEETEGSGLQLLKKRKGKFRKMQDKFQCMQKHTGSNTETPNAATIAILQQMADYYDKLGDEWRLRAYRKAMSTLRNHPTKVCTREEALALPQIGERLATKIEEIAVTSRLRRLESAKAEASDQTLQTFMQIYGVGPAQASKWVDAGYKTIDDLSAMAELTDNQRIGIEHYEDFNTRIPRAEVEQHGNIVRKTLQKIDPAFEVIVGGSYRRGASTSGDIDCILTRPNTGSAFIRQVVLDQLVPKLFAKKFLVAELAATSRDDGSKWHGASRLPTSDPDAAPNPWRRIDFLLVPSDDLGAALLYFTGDDIFNRSMRLLAGTKGMRLNQRGLYKDVIRGRGREKLSEGTLVEGKDEKRIFDILGVPWRPPEYRIC